MTTPACPSYAGYRFPAEIISHAVWLYFRFPLSLRIVEEMLAARGITVSHETIRQWALKFGQDFANQIRRRLPTAGDKWHLDEVAIKIALPTPNAAAILSIPMFPATKASRMSYSVYDPRHDGIELAPAGILHQSIKAW